MEMNGMINKIPLEYGIIFGVSPCTDGRLKVSRD